MNHEGRAAINIAHGSKMVLPTAKLVPQTDQLSESKVADFRSMLRDGRKAPPILVYPKEDGTFQIRDGTHRYHALTAEGFDRVECIVVGGPGR